MEHADGKEHCPPPPHPGDMIEDLDQRGFFWRLLGLPFDDRDQPVLALWQGIPPPPKAGDLIEDVRKDDPFKRIRG